MGRIYFTFVEMLAAAVFLVPICFFYGRVKVLSRKWLLADILFACYLAAVFALVGVPNVTYIRFDFSINWIPFIGMIPDLKNACLNVLLFVPLGMFLPFLWERYRQGKTTVCMGLALSCFVELIQIFTFRATDIDDVITNTLGTLIGFYLVKIATKGFSKYVFPNKRSGEFWILLLTVLAVMFFGHPFASLLLWRIL